MSLIFPPFLIFCIPSLQPGITSFSGNRIGPSKFFVVSNVVPSESVPKRKQNMSELLLLAAVLNKG